MDPPDVLAVDRRQIRHELCSQWWEKDVLTLALMAVLAFYTHGVNVDKNGQATLRQAKDWYGIRGAGRPGAASGSDN